MLSFFVLGVRLIVAPDLLKLPLHIAEGTRNSDSFGNEGQSLCLGSALMSPFHEVT